MPGTPHKKANSLINETSPYLLQHAYNPVNWFPFSNEAFETAKKENKPVLISIGYSACHWCHVMEHESFEDEQVAELMNKHFVNIKVDREERSDVDMLYMQAVQLMTGHGGWPLNCFVLPDGRPFYGGTYFNKVQWINTLKSLNNLYEHDYKKVDEYATELTNGIKQAELITVSKDEIKQDKKILQECVRRWKTRTDNVEGGPNKAPKFPLPSNYEFLLRYAKLEQDDELLKHVELTLTKMAFGGIYDQLYGGFARYSTDMLWKVPHFEKMLYDNAQLASLYCEAFTLTKNQLYKEVATDILDFVEREWLNEVGCFYSAYDADSDGEEGKYYVWNKADLEDVLGADYAIFSRYFEINEKGYWEHGNYILMRSEDPGQLLAEYHLTAGELRKKIESCKEKLKQEAKSRIKPGLDDKSITAWNAMMCSAYAKAFLCFGVEKHKTIALKSLDFILSNLMTPGGGLFRTYKNGESKISGFLDDYAFVIEALMNIYLITQNELHLEKAKELCGYSLVHFNNPENAFLFYSDDQSANLVARTTEVHDNVTPASNSQMAINLMRLGIYFGERSWMERAEKMLHKVLDDLKNYGSAYSNWGCLALNLTYPFKELVIVGKNVDEKFRELYQHGLTNTIFAVSDKPSELPLLQSRYVANQTLYYICENNTCQLPVHSVKETLEQLA
jgi:uncharacterized protein YyaL (SSP411 family)